MKVFLVFLALVIVFTGALAFASDSQRFVLLQKRLKVLAEECAEAAALCIDEEESQKQGRICIDLARGQAAAESFLAQSSYLKTFGEASLGVRISSFGSSGVRAELIWKNKAARAAAYEWVKR